MRHLVTVLFLVGMMSAYAQEVNAPSTEFLEFLGQWETDDGQWQDPIEMLEIEDADLQQSQYKTVSEDKDHDE